MQRPFLLLSALFFLATGLRAQSCQGDTILYEDFANGFSGNNSLGLSWDTSGTYQAWRACPSNCTSNGGFTDVGPLKSSTDTNGYVNLDIQYAAGYVDSSSGPPPEQHLEIGPMDLSSISNWVQLRFETVFYHCCASGHELQVQVSTDGGTTWPDTIPVLPGTGNSTSENPSKVVIRLDSAISANPSNVSLRFTWPPTLSGSDVSGVYNWYIDDVWVGQHNLNDMKAKETTYEMASAGVTADLGNPVEYTMVPNCYNSCIKAGGEICNVGRDTVWGARLQTRVLKLSNGNQVFQATSDADTLAPMTCVGDTSGLADPDTVWPGGCFSTLDTGFYELQYRAVLDDSVDCDTSDNFGKAEQFKVTLNTLALDEYAMTGSVDDAIVAPVAGGSYDMFTAYNVIGQDWFNGKNDTIDSLSFYVHDTTEVGAGPIRLGVNPNLSTSPSDSIYGLTPDHYVTASDIGSWVTLPITHNGKGDSLPNGLPVSDLSSDSITTAYLYYAGGSYRFGLGTSGNNPGYGCYAEGNFGGGGSALYRTSNIPMIRVIMDDSFLPADLEVSNDTLFANPNASSYTWVDCDTGTGGVISSASGPVFYPDSNGLYSVSVNDPSTSCTDSPSCVTSLPNSVWDASALKTDGLLIGSHFLDSTRGWVVDLGGKAHYTNDAGDSWDLRLDTNLALFAIHFQNSSNGWVVGANGEILRTTDGGSSWNPQSSGVTDILYDCHFRGPDTGWVVGQNGTILKTTDGGSNWSTVPSGLTMDLHAIHFEDDSLGWVAGNGGTVLHSTDGGNSWSTQSTGTSEDLYGITFVSDTAGWTVGTNGTVLHTDDGGGSWSSQASGTNEFLFSVNFVSQNEGWIVGANGTLLHTTNGRTTWNEVFDTRLHSFRDIQVIDERTAYIVGAAGTYLRKGAGTASLSSRTKQKARITIRPNPARDRVHLELEGSAHRKMSYTLYTSTGRKAIHRTSFDAPRTTIELDALESGLYFLQVRWKGEQGQQRLNVKKMMIE